jgi:hypothetical protein
VPAFDLYWRLIGLPLSRLKGGVVDSIPISVVETALWLGGLATVLLLLSFLPSGFRPAQVVPRGVLLTLGPGFLLALGLGQGAFPLSLAPTAWRKSLGASYGVDSLGMSEFKAWARAREAG